MLTVEPSAAMEFRSWAGEVFDILIYDVSSHVNIEAGGRAAVGPRSAIFGRSKGIRGPFGPVVIIASAQGFSQANFPFALIPGALKSRTSKYFETTT